MAQGMGEIEVAGENQGRSSWKDRVYDHHFLKDKSQQTSKYDPIHTARKIILIDDSEVFDVQWHKRDHLVGVVGTSQHRTLFALYGMSD
jgi:hypothetical protein